MSTERIIKKILKKSIHRNSFYSEISILKSIKHPRIPIIYDVEEDESAYYIIEEYIYGMNLSAYIKEKGVLSLEKAVSFGIKICEIVSFLHGQKPVPVLFLDIHPENIIINEDKIYLVDFGSSYYLGETDRRELLMGTVGYAAPEQYRYDRLDERTDIYGIGAVLYYMVTGRSCGHNGAKSLEIPNNITGKYKAIVLQCLSEDMSKRLNSADAVARNLKELIKNDNAYSNENEPLIISVVGTEKHIGTTHISLALAEFLSETGRATVYEEMNESNHLRLLARHQGLKYRNGYFCHKKLMLKPEYGPQVQLETECSCIVRDYGSVKVSELGSTHVVLLVAGVKEWEIDHSIDVCRRWQETGNKLFILANQATVDRMHILFTATGQVGVQVPYIRDVLNNDDDTNNFFHELMKAMENGTTGGEPHKKKAGLFGRTAKKAENSRNRNNWNS